MAGELAKPSPRLADMMPASKRMVTSMDLTNPENRKRLMSCLNDCYGRLTDELNTPIKMVDYMAHDVELVDKVTGELTPAVRLVMIDVEGCTHECVSATLLNSLSAVVFAYGEPPWEGGLEMTVRQKKGKAQQVFWFEVK